MTLLTYWPQHVRTGGLADVQNTKEEIAALLTERAKLFRRLQHIKTRLDVRGYSGRRVAARISTQKERVGQILHGIKLISSVTPEIRRFPERSFGPFRQSSNKFGAILTPNHRRQAIGQTADL